MRSLGPLLMLCALAFVLYRVWPKDALDALRHDPDATLRWPWQAPEVQSDAEAETTAPFEASATPQAASTPSRPALRVLFVGNSHTHRNQMPALIAGLAAATPGLRPFQQVMEAPGGARLIDHVQKGRVAARLSTERFDYVVLQEQQQWPSFGAEQRKREFEAPASTLDVLAKAANAKTWLFLTWARREGDLENKPNDSYAAMQERVRNGYRDLARALNATVVPVGLVWQQVVRSEPELPLWDRDGSHASRFGSYLAACVFFKAFYDRSPLGNTYHAGLPAPDAERLQRAADAATARYDASQL